MPIDRDKALGADVPRIDYSWTEDDVIGYNLGVGAGNPPTDSRELTYAYEGDLKALPTFGTLPPFAMMMSLGGVEGMEINLAQVLHGEHELTVHRPIPTSGSVRQAGRMVDIYDKGKGALVVVEVTSTLDATGEPLFTNRAGIFLRGEGGFGGDKGPARDDVAPDTEPDHVVESPTLPQQALLYRMASGDRNPLHADPAFAALAGYERAILHGLCTYGIVGKAVVDTIFDGDPDRFGSFRARFTGHVFPGETLVTRMWVDDVGVLLTTETKDRGSMVLANARVLYR